MLCFPGGQIPPPALCPKGPSDEARYPELQSASDLLPATLSPPFHDGQPSTVEVCSACHPFYTGKQKIVVTGSRRALRQIRFRAAPGLIFAQRRHRRKGSRGCLFLPGSHPPPGRRAPMPAAPLCPAGNGRTGWKDRAHRRLIWTGGHHRHLPWRGDDHHPPRPGSRHPHLWRLVDARDRRRSLSTTILPLYFLGSAPSCRALLGGLLPVHDAARLRQQRLHRRLPLLDRNRRPPLPGAETAFFASDPAGPGSPGPRRSPYETSRCWLNSPAWLCVTPAWSTPNVRSAAGTGSGLGNGSPSSPAACPVRELTDARAAGCPCCAPPAAPAPSSPASPLV